MERMWKNFWILSLGVLVLSTPAQSKNDNVWDDIVRKVFKNSKVLRLTAGRESYPHLRYSPKVISFRGVVELPSHIYLTSGAGLVHNISAQLIIDGQIVCNYSPKSNEKDHNKVYFLRECSDHSRAKDRMNVNNKIELKLNYASSENASLLANVRVVQSDMVEYGLVFPYLTPSEGQILMFNGEAWVAADVDQLDIQGLQGEQGPQGAQGPMGPAGEKGDKGDPGVAGAAGPKGDKGDPGVAGAAGPKGDKGDPGVAGAAGPKGDKGDPGVAGAAGPKGDKGDPGVAGPAGAQGPKGDKGDKGDPGVAGPAGADGAPGVAGPAGAQGPKGDKGDPGVAGPAGAQGPMGPIGPQGPAGADGAPGVAGPAGADGAPGVAGPKGDKGDKGDRGLSEIAYLRDEKVSGTQGGTCTAGGGWIPRALNTLGGDNSFISLNNNRFALQPGTYFIEIQAPAYAVGYHQAKLKVIETNIDVLYGTSMVSLPSNPSTNHSVIMGEIVVAQASTFEIQHRCSNDKLSFGFGIAVSFGSPEIYTQVKIIKKQ